jgi:integrase/recombinase XerD
MAFDPRRVRLSGPLEPFGAGFAAELVRQGYTRDSARLQLLLMAHLSRWLASDSLDAHGLSQANLERFLDARRTAGYTAHLTPKALHPMLTYLRRLGVAPMPPAPKPAGPVQAVLKRYRLYLTVERGLVPETVRGYVDAVRPFLRSRLSTAGGIDLEGLGADDVTAFLVVRSPKLTRCSAKLAVTALRSLLGFLYLDGTIQHQLTAAVPAVAGWRLARLPKGLDPSEVRGLLVSCDRQTANGRRDFAILTVLIRLGLRSGELAALGLDDIDWHAGEIVVRGKGRRVDRLPMPSDVGEAIAAYLRTGRPPTAADRTVFVRVKAPHRALTSGGVGHVVRAAARRAGLEQIHAHRLRHTVATEMLRAGASLREIGQVLRHRRAQTTAIYAKVDREALRTIARPWPGGVA